MAADDVARVVFRRVLPGGDGREVVEEREVRCAPSELARVMGAPWEPPPQPDPAASPGLLRLGETVGSALEAMRFEVREGRDEEGGRRWTLGFVRGEVELDGGVGEAPAGEGEPEGEPEGAAEPERSGGAPQDRAEARRGGSVRLEHRARLRLRADEEGEVTETALPGNVIHVTEQALSLLKYGNAYGILDLTLVVHLHADGEG